MPPARPARLLWPPLLVAGLLGLALMLGALGGARPAGAVVPGKGRSAYTHRSWPSLAHASTVRALLVSRNRGQLWVGTSDGLVRIDGQRVITFDARRLPGIVDGNITALSESPEGWLWVASADRGLSRVRGQQVTTWGKRDGLPSDRVRALEAGADGSLWVGTDGGVARFLRGQDRPISAREGLPPGRTVALAHDRSGRLWVGTLGGLAWWNQRSGSWQRESTPWPDSVRVSTLRASSEGSLWVGTDGAGLWQRQGNSWRAYGLPEGLGSQRVTTIWEDRDQQLWVASREGNLLVRGRGEDAFQVMLLSPRICENVIEVVADDDEGGLWLGTEACGLHRVEDRPIRVLEESEGLPRNQILGLQGSRDGSLVWVSTRGGGLAMIQTSNSLVRELPCAPDLPCPRCWDMTPGAGLTLRAVCNKTGLQWDGRKMVRWQLPAEVKGVELVMEASDGAVWLASGNRVFRWQTGSPAGAGGAGATVEMAGQDELRGKRVMHEGRAGRVYIAGDDGVAIWHGSGPLELHRLPVGQDPGEASNLIDTPDGSLWVGTKGMGLRRLKGGRFATINTSHGLPTNWIAQMLPDDRGQLWMSGSKGIFTVELAELDQVAEGRRSRMHAAIYDGADGVLMSSDSFGHPAGWRGPDGRLWFATHGGVVIVDPAATRARPRPQALIEEGRVGEHRLQRELGAYLVQPGQQLDPLLLGPGSGDMEARFGVLSFAVPETISFRHRLPGKDGEWVESGTGRIAHYAELGPGDYTLEVQARHRDGQWGPSDRSLRFRVRPPFHRSPWFAALVVVSVLLGLLLVHRVRLLRARAGLHAVMAERGRIARDLHDTLAQSFVATSVQLECLDHALEGQDSPAARKHLDTAMRVVRDSLEEARRSVWVLRPQALERGLPAALETLVRRTAPAAGAGPAGRARVDLEVVGAARPLSPLTEANLLRIAQEAVANAYRHARASRISLRLAFETDSVSLTVTDDGSGIAPAAGGGSGIQQGIAGMKERARDMGAEITIQGAAAGGTVVRVQIPLRGARRGMGWFSGGGGGGGSGGAASAPAGGGKE